MFNHFKSIKNLDDRFNHLIISNSYPHNLTTKLTYHLYEEIIRVYLENFNLI
jgi:hypothetical protein